MQPGSWFHFRLLPAKTKNMSENPSEQVQCFDFQFDFPFDYSVNHFNHCILSKPLLSIIFNFWFDFTIDYNYKLHIKNLLNCVSIPLHLKTRLFPLYDLYTIIK